VTVNDVANKTETVITNIPVYAGKIAGFVIRTSGKVIAFPFKQMEKVSK
jgi:hypothetical protein